MKEDSIKALKQFGREDLIDSPYGYDIDDNVEVFMTIRQMIKYNNLQSQLKAKEEVIKEAREKLKLLHYLFPDYDDMHKRIEELEEILSKGENK